MSYLGHASVPTSSYLLHAQLPGPAYFNYLIFFDSCFPEKCIFNDLPLGLKAQQKHFDVHLKLHLFSGTIDFNNQPTSPSFSPVRFFKIRIFGSGFDTAATWHCLRHSRHPFIRVLPPNDSSISELFHHLASLSFSSTGNKTTANFQHLKEKFFFQP